MKIILYGVIICLTLGCKGDFILKDRTDCVQACLDTLYRHQRKAYQYLEKNKLILLRDTFTKALHQIHYGNNNLILKEANSRERQAYLNGNDTANNYLKVQCLPMGVNNQTLLLFNGNHTVKFFVNKKGNLWHVKIAEMTIR